MQSATFLHPDGWGWRPAEVTVMHLCFTVKRRRSTDILMAVASAALLQFGPVFFSYLRTQSDYISHQPSCSGRDNELSAVVSCPLSPQIDHSDDTVVLHVKQVCVCVCVCVCVSACSSFLLLYQEKSEAAAAFLSNHTRNSAPIVRISTKQTLSTLCFYSRALISSLTCSLVFMM